MKKCGQKKFLNDHNWRSLKLLVKSDHKESDKVMQLPCLVPTVHASGLIQSVRSRFSDVMCQTNEVS